MRSVFVIAAVAVACFSGPSQAQNVSVGSAPAGEPAVRLVQACGWYAISTCSRRPGPARRAADDYGGYVVRTDGIANFRPGWYCAVEGPVSKERAERRMWQMQDLGADSAYIKFGC